MCGNRERRRMKKGKERGTAGKQEVRGVGLWTEKEGEKRRVRWRMEREERREACKRGLRVKRVSRE